MSWLCNKRQTRALVNLKIYNGTSIECFVKQFLLEYVYDVWCNISSRLFHWISGEGVDLIFNEFTLLPFYFAFEVQ